MGLPLQKGTRVIKRYSSIGANSPLDARLTRARAVAARKSLARVDRLAQVPHLLQGHSVMNLLRACRELRTNLAHTGAPGGSTSIGMERRRAQSGCLWPIVLKNSNFSNEAIREDGAALTPSVSYSERPGVSAPRFIQLLPPRFLASDLATWPFFAGSALLRPSETRLAHL